MVNETFNILRLLIEHQEEKFSIRKISKRRKVNYKSAYNAVMKLQNEGVVDLEKIGNTINCRFNKKFNPLVFSVEDERRKELLKNKNIKIIYSRLNELGFSFVVLIFGSIVKSTFNKYSDIDLLIISEKQKEIESVLSLIPLKIHPTFITNKEFISMAKTREFSVVSEAIKKNIILIGIEDYYRLLEKVIL